MVPREEKPGVHIASGANVYHLHDAAETDSGICFSDERDPCWHSPHNPNCLRSSYHDLRQPCASLPEIAAAVGACRNSCHSDCSLPVVLEDGVHEIKINMSMAEKNCRICQLGLEETPESGLPIELGCSCKYDLAAAHKQCAETWFKIKGNKVCEICGSTAKNITFTNEIETLEQCNDAGSNPPPPAPPPEESRNLWQGHRLLNFLLACMVFAFIISWLFHFNVPG